MVKSGNRVARILLGMVAALTLAVMAAPGQAAAQAYSDYDGDGLSDADEYYYGTHPMYADSDGDGLSDGQEVWIYGAYPTYADSDGDGYGDGNEVATGNDPLLAPVIETRGGGTYGGYDVGDAYEDAAIAESIRAEGERDQENWEDTTCNPYMEDNSCG